MDGELAGPPLPPTPTNPEAPVDGRDKIGQAQYGGQPVAHAGPLQTKHLSRVITSALWRDGAVMWRKQGGCHPRCLPTTQRSPSPQSSDSASCFITCADGTHGSPPHDNNNKHTKLLSRFATADTTCDPSSAAGYRSSHPMHGAAEAAPRTRAQIWLVIVCSRGQRTHDSTPLTARGKARRTTVQTNHAVGSSNQQM